MLHFEGFAVRRRFDLELENKAGIDYRVDRDGPAPYRERRPLSAVGFVLAVAGFLKKEITYHYEQMRKLSPGIGPAARLVYVSWSC